MPNNSDNPHLNGTCNCDVKSMLQMERLLHDKIGKTAAEWDAETQTDHDVRNYKPATVEQTLDIMLGGSIPKPDSGRKPRVHEITLDMRGGVLPHRDIVPMNQYSEAPVPHMALLPNDGTMNQDSSKITPRFTQTVTQPYTLQHPSDYPQSGQDISDERLDLWQHEIDIALEADSVNKEQTAKPCGDAETQTQKDFIMKNALELIAYARANKKTVGIAAGVISVVALAVYGVLAYRRNSEEA